MTAIERAPFYNDLKLLNVDHLRKGNHQKGTKEQYSRKGRRRKVFRQVKAHISFTGRGVTANAGTAVVSRTLESFHIPGQLEAITADLDKGRRHPTHEILQQLIALRIPGGEAISDAAALLAEPAVAALHG